MVTSKKYFKNAEKVFTRLETELFNELNKADEHQNPNKIKRVNKELLIISPIIVHFEINHLV